MNRIDRKTPRTLEEAFGPGARLTMKDGENWKYEVLGFIVSVLIFAPLVVWAFFLLTD